MKKIKKQILTIAFFAFMSVAFNSNAQQTFVVNEIYAYMSKGQNTGFEIPLQDAKPEDTINSFKKFISKYKGKFVSPSKKSPEGFIDNALIKEVSANTVDMYFTSQATEYGSKLIVFVDLGGAFLGSQNQAMGFGAMQNILKEFARQQAVTVSEEQVKVEEKALKVLESDLKKLNDEKADYIKDIEKAKALIAQREQDLVNNATNQGTKTQQIEIQKTILQTVRDKRAALGK